MLHIRLEREPRLELRLRRVQLLICADTVDGFLIDAGHGAFGPRAGPVLLADGAHEALRGKNGGPLHHARSTVFIQEGEQRLARFQGGDRLLRIKGRIRPERLCRHFDRFLVQRRVGPKGVLNPVAQLTENGHRDVRRALGNEVYPDALGTDQPDHLLNLLHQGAAAVVEKEVRLIKEEDDAGLVAVPLLGQEIVQLRQHPKKEGGIHRGIIEKPVRRKDVDVALAFRADAQPVVNVDGGLAEEGVPSLILQDGDGPLNRPDARRGNIAVIQRVILRVFPDVNQHGFQIPDVLQGVALVIGDAEKDVHHAGLGFVEAQHAAEQQGAHLLHRGADGMALFAVNIPEHGGESVIAEAVRIHPAAQQPPVERFAAHTGVHHAAQVTLDIAEENGHTHVGKAFRQHLQGDGFARSCCPGDQAVAVRHMRKQEHRTPGARTDPDFAVLQHSGPSRNSFLLIKYVTHFGLSRQELGTRTEV